jgi:hypothetical protein
VCSAPSIYLSRTGTILAADVSEVFAMATVHAHDRILVVDRKLFRDDNTRLFIGVVEDYDAGVVRARGYAYHINPYEVAGTERRAEERVRIVSLSAGDIIYTLPKDVDITRLQVKRSPKSLVVTDDRSLMMDLSEWLYRV